jgi:glycosyltransferase involved in cell wall biosynthesis
VATKGILEAVKAAKEAKIKLKIVGAAAGYGDLRQDIIKIGGNVEILGRVEDKVLWELYARARGFIALARDEDFGMTVVEAQAAGTPVIAFNGGGFRESVLDGKTGFLIDATDTKTIKNAIERFEKKKWDRRLIQSHAQKFSKERFRKKVLQFIKQNARITGS